jgi:hypothetical protein
MGTAALLGPQGGAGIVASPGQQGRAAATSPSQQGGMVAASPGQQGGVGTAASSGQQHGASGDGFVLRPAAKA